MDDLPVISIILHGNFYKLIGEQDGIINIQGPEDYLKQGGIHIEQKLEFLFIKRQEFIHVEFEEGRMPVRGFYAFPVEFLPSFVIINANVPDICFMCPAFQDWDAERKNSVGSHDMAPVPVGLLGIMVVSFNDPCRMDQEFGKILHRSEIRNAQQSGIRVTG
jgi:hypothetical protein